MRPTSLFPVVVFVALAASSASLRAEPLIKISKETTFITEPLRDDGLPDYERYLRERFSKGVTPENNAAVLFWQAMGPGDSKLEEFAAVAKAIGMSRIPTKEESLESTSVFGHGPIHERISIWLQEQGALPPKPANDDSENSPWENQSYELVSEVLELAKTQPWIAAEIPPLADWVAVNQKPMNLLLETTNRPRFDSPEPAWLNDKRDYLIAGISMLEVQSCRDATSALGTRAMFHLGRGDYDSAWRDLLAAHRITRLWDSQSNFLVDELVAKACMNEAQVLTRVLLADQYLPARKARQILADLEALDPPKFSVEVLNIGERIYTIDLLLSLMEDRQNLDPIVANLVKEEIEILESGSVNWNLVLTEVNKHFDALIAVAKIADRTERKRELEKLQAQQYTVDSKNLTQLDRDQRSLALASAFDLIDELSFWIVDSRERILTQNNFTRLAAALAAFRAETGHYPEQLQELVPNNLEKLPVDTFNKAPYAYRRTENGYLLYTPGKNGNDDGGSNHDLEIYRGYSAALNRYDSVKTLLGSDVPKLQAQFNPANAKRSEQTWDLLGPLSDHIPEDADDIAIRVPLPKLELPKKSQ